MPAMTAKELIKSLAGNKKAVQVGSLYVGSIATIVVGFLISVVNTRTLGPERYGDYRFLNNLFGFLTTIASLGLFATGAQVLAQLKGEEDKKHQYLGALLVITLVMSVVLMLASVLIAFLEPYVFGNNLGNLVLLFSPMVAVLVFQSCIEAVLQGDNRIHDLAFFKLAPGVLFLVSLVAAMVLHKVSLVLTLALQLLSSAAIVLALVHRLAPKFSNFAQRWKELWAVNKNYGQHVYVGILSNVATTYLATFMISGFLDNTRVGFFSLAVNITMPLTQVSGVIGTTYFKDFAHLDHLPKKVTWATAGLTAVTLALFILLIKPVVLLIYTEKFAEVAFLAAIVAAGSAANGVGDYVNRFLGAHGRGKALRNGAIIVGVVNVLGYTFLVRLIGVEGAALTWLIAGLTYCGVMIWSYRAFRRESL